MLGDFNTDLVMTPAERSAASVLIVEADSMSRNSLRTCLKSLGYGGISDATTNEQAFEKITQRKFSHILFDAKKTAGMSPKEFIKKVLELDNTTVAIPTSSEPNVDDVFDLFVMGARGFLVKPFNIESVENSIVMATKGEPMAEAVLQAKDRNGALVAIMMAALDRTATTMRQGQKFETAQREIPRALAGFKRAADLAATFRKGGDEDLIKAIQDFCVERSKGPATRLGRLRKRLKAGRKEDDDETGDASSEA